MADNEIFDDPEKLKRGLVKVLECVATISSAAAVVNPIFGVAGSLIRVVLHHVDDEDILKLKHEFGSVNRALDEISQENRQALLQIRKETVDKQYHEVEENIRNQFRKFMEIVEAKPEQVQCKKDDFVESFINDKDDQNLYTLYEGVMGKRKLFSQPILDIYMKHSQGDQHVMENLCTRLAYLFCIGYIALMGYYGILGDDLESLVTSQKKGLESFHAISQKHLQRHLRQVGEEIIWTRFCHPRMEISAHVSCDPPELLHVAHCARFILMNKHHAPFLSKNSSEHFYLLPFCEESARSSQARLIYRHLSDCCQVLSKPKSSLRILSARNFLSVARTLPLCSSHTNSDHKYPPRAKT